MTSSANPYAHYNQPQVDDDDDLIDPDDSMTSCAGFYGKKL
jgi:hypothetical protein